MLDDGVTSICYFRGAWGTGSVPIMSSTSNAAWLANTVFDGARAFEGVAPDLDLHCQRVIRSARGLNLLPAVTAEQIEALAWEGIRQFAPNTPLYIRPMFWAEDGLVIPTPESTEFALVLKNTLDAIGPLFTPSPLRGEATG